MGECPSVEGGRGSRCFQRTARSDGDIQSHRGWCQACGIALTLFCIFYQGAETVNLWVGVLDTRTHLVDFGLAKLNAATCGILFTFVLMAVSLLILPTRGAALDA